MNRKIVVHGGRAHQDDFLATCVILAKDPSVNMVERRFPTDADLKDKDVYVVDHGREYDPDMLNFDHHHLPEVTCAFTQVLEYFDLRDDDAMPSISFIEKNDCRGPNVAMGDYGLDGSLYDTFLSPIVDGMLSIFSKADKIPNSYFSQLMKDIGKNIIYKICNYRKALADYNNNAKLVEVECDYDNEKIIINVLDTRSCKEYLNVFEVKKFGTYKYERSIAAIFSDCDRTEGEVRLTRTGEDELDFNGGKKHCTFVHVTGFLACFKNEDDMSKIVKKSVKE